MVLQCKFVDKGYDKFLILQKFGINKSMHVMICFSNIPEKVNKKVMIYYLFENIQRIKILIQFLQIDPKEGASLAKEPRFN
jgi:hypothetical protein